LVLIYNQNYCVNYFEVIFFAQINKLLKTMKKLIFKSTIKRKIEQLFLLLLILSINLNAQIPGCITPSQNMAVNGNFSAGNFGFTSNVPFSTACTAGTYMVGTNFTNKCAVWPSVFDHTTGG
jgi:hypothetical protein